MTFWQRSVKRSFDIVTSLIGLSIFFWLILICWLIATIDTKQNGFFTQLRVGKNNKLFKIIKIRTMRPVEGVNGVVTQSNDPRITRVGAVLRKFKLDELPQLINVLLGQMSFVGPRPDVPGFADELQGGDRIILSVRPGITSYATLAFRNEEELLSLQEDPEQYNREVIFPEKVKINRFYIENYSFRNDILCIFVTVIPSLMDKVLPIHKQSNNNKV